MRLDIKNNAKRGIKHGVINRIFTLLFPFIVQTVLIRQLGMEYVGVKSLFSSILSILSLVELGIGSAVVFSMYKPIAEDDIEKICQYFTLYKKMYRAIGFIVLVLGSLITPFLPFLIHDSFPSEINLYIVYALYLFNSVLSYWLFAYKKSLLYAYQRTDMISQISSIITIVLCTIQVAVLLLTKNYYLFMAVAIVCTIINNLIVSYFVDKMFPAIKCVNINTKELFRTIKTKVYGLVIGEICGASRNTFDSIFISIFMGLTAAAVYSNYFYVIIIMNGFTGVIYDSFLSGIGNSAVLDDKKTQYEMMLKLNFAYMILSGFISVCMLCLYQPFMVLWVGSNNTYPNYIMVLYPIYFYILKMGDVGAVFTNAAGLFWENRHRFIIETVANIVLNYLLIIKLGILGILLATIISLFFIGFFGSTFVIFKHYFESGMAKYLFQHFSMMLLTLIIGIIVFICCNLMHFQSPLIELLIKTIICLFSVPLFYFVSLSKTKIFKETIKLLGK